MKPEHSSSFHHSDADAWLDKATVGLRDQTIPPGPSQRLVEKTRQAVAELVLTSGTRVPDHVWAQRWRWLLLPRTLVGLAATIFICLTLAIIYRSAFREPATLAHGTVGPEHRPVTPEIAKALPIHASVQPAAPVVAPVQPRKENRDLADGTIAGRVIFAAPPVRPMPLASVNLMPECKRLHGGPIFDESLLVSSDGGLANVVVSVSSGLSGWLREEFPPPVEQAVLNQKGCVFAPHVIAIMVGQPLLVKNSDPVLHNVHLLAVNNTPLNLGQPTTALTATDPFESPEVFRVTCDVHPWMQAWVRVVDNPYFAVTDRQGHFTIRGLPPGTYTLKAWHEQLGVRELQVVIPPGQGAAADFAFPPAG